MDSAEGTPSSPVQPEPAPAAAEAPVAPLPASEPSGDVPPTAVSVPSVASASAVPGSLATPTPSAVPFAQASDVASLVARARAAQPGWSALPVEQRIRALIRVRDVLLERAETMASEIARETGKPEVEAMLADVLPSSDVINYWCQGIEELLTPIDVELDRGSYPGKSGWTFRDPRGVVGLITPWSFPVAVPFRTLAPALLAGNTIVWKPSDVAPGSAKLVEELFAGLVPDGVLVVAQGAGDVGQALAEADVDLVVFAGTVANGKTVAKACAERVSPCSLQLGGKDAAIVLADANLERAANGIVWAALTNAGQAAGSVERVYVERTVAESFVDRVKTAVAALRPGVDIGSLGTEKGRASVATQVDASTAGGATVVQGGATSERFIPPVVVRVESDASPVMQEETFGPVIPIAVVADVEEAIARVNASRYGLGASIWSKNTSRAEQLAHRLRVGVVTINNHGFTAAVPSVPTSGFGLSGNGLTGSPAALDVLTRPRFVLTDTSTSAREMWWYPYTPALRTIATSMALVRGGKTNVFRKLGAFFALLGGMMKRFKA